MSCLDSTPSSDELMSMESLKALVAANGASIARLCAKLGVKVDAPRESTSPPTAPICVQGAVWALPVLVETSSTPALQPCIVPKPKPSTPTKCSMECLDEQDNETCQVFGEITRKVSDPAVDLMTARPTMCLLHSSSHVPGQGVPLLATTVRVPPHPPDWPGTPQKQEAPPPPWPPSATSSIHHKEQCKLSNEGVNALGSYLAIICACPHGTSISSHIIREMVVKVSTRQSLSQFAHNQSAQLVRTQQATYFLHVEQLLASRLSRQWDPEGSKYACWVLNCKYFDGNTKVYFRNMRVDLNVWEKDKFRVISIELYVQWDPGIMKVLLMLAMFWENLQSILGPDFYPRTSKDDLSLDAITLSQASGQRIVFCLPSMWDISESLLFQFFVGVIQAEQVGEIRHMKCKEESEILENIQEKFRMLPADIFHMNFRVQLISLENQFLSLEAFKGSVATWLPSTQMKVAEDNGETDHCCFHWASRLCLVQRQNMLLGVLCSTPSPTLQVSIKYLLEQQNERSSSLFAAIELTLCTLQRRMLQPVEEFKELESTYRAENHGAVDSVVSVCTPLIHNINTCPLGNFLGGILSKKKAEGQWWIICQTKLKCGASICSLEEDSKCMILTNRKKMIYLTVIYPMSSCNSGFASSRSIRHPVHEFSGRRSSGVDVKLVANFVALLLGSLPQLSFSSLGYYNCHKYLLHGKNIWLHSCSGWKYFRLPDDSYQPCDPSLINWNPNAMHNVSLKLSWGQAMSPEMEISLLGYVGNFAEHFPRAEKLRSLWNVSCKLAYGLQLVPCCYVWLSHGFLMCHCHATPLSNYQWADEDAADTRKQHAVQVQSMETPWDPGGATGRWWSSPCYNREPFQGGSIVIALDTFFEQVHVDQHYYLDFYDGYFIDLAQVRSNNGYHCDNSSTKERQVAWDPGGKGWHRLEGKAEFQGGRNATGLPSTRPWASCWMGQRLSLQQLRYKRKDSGNQGGIEDELCCG